MQIPVTEMTPNQLTRELERAEQLKSRRIDELIAAGRGDERSSETMAKTDGLSVAYRTVTLRLEDLRQEKNRRLKFSDSLRRIPKSDRT